GSHPSLWLTHGSEERRRGADRARSRHWAHNGTGDPHGVARRQWHAGYMSDEAEPVTYPSGIPKPEFRAPAVAPDVILVTGMSGAGRTRAAAALGDLGWYVVDNLPPQMLGGLVEMVGSAADERLAVVV